MTLKNLDDRPFCGSRDHGRVSEGILISVPVSRETKAILRHKKRTLLFSYARHCCHVDSVPEIWKPSDHEGKPQHKTGAIFPRTHPGAALRYHVIFKFAVSKCHITACKIKHHFFRVWRKTNQVHANMTKTFINVRIPTRINNTYSTKPLYKE